MNFDGRTAQFRESVAVGSGTQLLQTAWLDLHFLQAISLADTKPQTPPQIETMNCGGGVFIENRTLEAGQQVSYERMQMQDLSVNNINGQLNAAGPGRLISVRRGGNAGFAMPGMTAKPVGFAAAQPPNSFNGNANANALKCLHLTFNKSITGNIKQKDLAFHGQVRAAYAPAQSWTTTLESDDPKELGDSAVVLHCDHMSVNDMSPMSNNGAGNIEMTATDNVIAEGTDFNARSSRLRGAP